MQHPLDHINETLSSLDGAMPAMNSIQLADATGTSHEDAARLIRRAVYYADVEGDQWCHFTAKRFEDENGADFFVLTCSRNLIKRIACELGGWQEECILTAMESRRNRPRSKVFDDYIVDQVAFSTRYGLSATAKQHLTNLLGRATLSPVFSCGAGFKDAVMATEVSGDLVGVTEGNRTWVAHRLSDVARLAKIDGYDDAETREQWFAERAEMYGFVDQLDYTHDDHFRRLKSAAPNEIRIASFNSMFLVQAELAELHNAEHEGEYPGSVHDIGMHGIGSWKIAEQLTRAALDAM